ncbi:MAG: SDR family NAD(P)-dependent oxidoreductase, partial [Promethearchaeota archaeon]
ISKTIREIHKIAPQSKLDSVQADFTSLKQVRAMSDELHKKYKKLDVLINNAAVIMTEYVLTEDNFETTFQVNYLAPFLLTLSLLDLLFNSDKKPARIINVASMAHASHLNIDDIPKQNWGPEYDAYSLSKLGNILFTFELAEKLNAVFEQKKAGDRDGNMNVPDGSAKALPITVNCLHPGVISTKLLHVSFPGGAPVSEGAKIPVFLATSPDVINITGKYFSHMRVAEPASIAYDKEIRKRLWEISEQMASIKFEDIISKLD